MKLELTITGMFFFGATLLLLGSLRGPAAVSPLQRAAARRQSMLERLQLRLRRAGMPDTNASLFALAVAGGMLVSFLVLAVLTKTWYAGVIVQPPLLFAVFAYLSARERSFVRRASEEMVPFLRKVESSVRAGRNAQTAFADALAETKLLSQALERTLIQLQLNRPFVDVLTESVELLPLRNWQSFVRYVEIHARAGGDLGNILSDAVEQINDQIMLQAEMRSLYGPIAKQQWILLGIAVGAAPFMHFVMNGMIDPLFQSLGGMIALAVAIGLMFLGWFVGRINVKAIERRIDL